MEVNQRRGGVLARRRAWADPHNIATQTATRTIAWFRLVMYTSVVTIRNALTPQKCFRL